MNYYSEKDIENIINEVLKKTCFQSSKSNSSVKTGAEKDFLVEVSARHVHLTTEAVEILFGKGARLSKKKDLSQPGEFLSNERVKLVTGKGEMDNVAVLGPERKAVQVELSATDARSLGVKAPVNLSGDLNGAGDVLIIGPCGYLMASGSCIVAKAHIHMTPSDASAFGVTDGQSVKVHLDTPRPVTIEDVVIRVKDSFSLAMHIDFDEANAAQASGNVRGSIVR